MGALVKLAAYLTPKAAELINEGAQRLWNIIVDDEVVEVD